MSFVGVDFGAKRIGIAYSSSGELASPDRVLTNPGSDDGAAALIAKVGLELEADCYVLGVPAGRRHDAATITERYERLAELLRQKSGKTVFLWDETLTTAEAAAMQRERGVGRREAKESIDKEAAALILQSWLDQRRMSS